ncbi:MAG: DNA-binding protein [Sphingobacteriia bacterium]|nr:DNA-binding protein [Sphingobacteriia bacterium]
MGTIAVAKSASEVRIEFRRAGVTIQEWAHANGYPPADVYALLSGRTRGHRGKAHEIAIRLGIKPSTALPGVLSLAKIEVSE